MEAGMRRGIPALEMELHLAPFPVKRMWFTKCLLVTSMEWALLLSAMSSQASSSIRALMVTWSVMVMVGSWKPCRACTRPPKMALMDWRV